MKFVETATAEGVEYKKYIEEKKYTENLSLNPSV